MSDNGQYNVYADLDMLLDYVQHGGKYEGKVIHDVVVGIRGFVDGLLQGRRAALNADSGDFRDKAIERIMHRLQAISNEGTYLNAEELIFRLNADKRLHPPKVTKEFHADVYVRDVGGKPAPFIMGDGAPHPLHETEKAIGYADGYDAGAKTTAESYETKVKQVRDMWAVQASDGNWNTDEYMHGMYVGLELALACLEARKPDLRIERFRALNPTQHTAPLGAQGKAVNKVTIERYGQREPETIRFEDIGKQHGTADDGRPLTTAEKAEAAYYAQGFKDGQATRKLLPDEEDNRYTRLERQLEYASKLNSDIQRQMEDVRTKNTDLEVLNRKLREASEHWREKCAKLEEQLAQTSATTVSGVNLLNILQCKLVRIGVKRREIDDTTGVETQEVRHGEYTPRCIVRISSKNNSFKLALVARRYGEDEDTMLGEDDISAWHRMG